MICRKKIIITRRSGRKFKVEGFSSLFSTLFSERHELLVAEILVLSSWRCCNLQ